MMGIRKDGMSLTYDDTRQLGDNRYDLMISMSMMMMMMIIVNRIMVLRLKT
jgi:hypothetical protein